MLTKLPNRTFYPAAASIPYRAAMTLCGTVPGGGNPGQGPGEWRMVCRNRLVFLGWQYSPGPGDFGDPGPWPKAIYTTDYVCLSEWVPG